MIRFDSIKAGTVTEIKTGVKTTLDEKYGDLFPSDKNVKVVIKPNMNANMNALTGNTTDLRLVAAVLEYLKDNDYTDITVAEGTNSGYYRNKIDVISRLRFDQLAKHYGAVVKDLNQSEKFPITFEDGVTASVAKDVIDSDFLINMPKLKTHFEIGMSVCLKNLMGTLVGQENKKKTHLKLAANILNINKVVKPDIHIVDGVIAMEGLGPTRGTPLKTGRVFIGDSPYLIDLMMARFAGFDEAEFRTLLEAKRQGLVTEDMTAFADAYNFDEKFHFAPPVAGPLATFIHSPKRQKYFLAVRNTAFFNMVCNTKLIGALLYATGLRQDVFIDEEMRLDKLSVDLKKCETCERKPCIEYCPTGVKLPEGLNENDKNCIDCLYCYCVCPYDAVEFHGVRGFLDEQLRQYDDVVKRIV